MPLVVAGNSLVVASIDGVAAPLPVGGFSTFALRFFADLESIGTVTAVDILNEAMENASVG